MTSAVSISDASCHQLVLGMLTDQRLAPTRPPSGGHCLTSNYRKVRSPHHRAPMGLPHARAVRSAVHTRGRSARVAHEELALDVELRVTNDETSLVHSHSAAPLTRCMQSIRAGSTKGGSRSTGCS